MIELKLNQIGELFEVAINKQFADDVIKGVVTDTRKDCTGKLFIALKGENFDGHDYVQTAFDKGAVAALVSNEFEGKQTAILVENTLKAYAKLANNWRKIVGPKVVAITGSNGKTTVKEMLGSILSKQGKTLVTKGNFNNEIGVPQTLCELSKDDEFAVIEMGANHKGEIERLVQIVEPDLVYVNNAAMAHVEGFGSLQGVRDAKGEMYRFAPSQSIALINADDLAAQQWVAQAQSQRIVQCAFNTQADIQAIAKDCGLDIKFNGQEIAVNLQVKGQHNKSNALAAASLAYLLDVDKNLIKQGLQEFKGFSGRLEFIKGIHDCILINDSYNANSASFKAGIDVLCELPGRAWLAMGDMGELGESAQQQHEEVVNYAKQSGVELLFAKGKMSQLAARLMAEKGLSYSNFEDMSEAIKQRIDDSTNLLIKGSRSAHMETLVGLLKQTDNLEGVH